MPISWAVQNRAGRQTVDSEAGDLGDLLRRGLVEVVPPSAVELSSAGLCSSVGAFAGAGAAVSGGGSFGCFEGV